MKLPNQKGSLIIEVLVSITIAVLATTAVGSLVVANSRLILASENETKATALAKESMEQAFAIKQENWNNIDPLPEGYYLIQRNGEVFEFLADDPYNPGETVSDIFLRKVYISKAYRDVNGIISEAGTEDPMVRKIEVTVLWPERGTTRDIVLISYITNWQGE